MFKYVICDIEHISFKLWLMVSMDTGRGVESFNAVNILYMYPHRKAEMFKHVCDMF